MNREEVIKECKNITDFIVNDRDNFFKTVSLERDDFKKELIERLESVFPEHKDDFYYIKIAEFLHDFFELSHDYNMNEWLKEEFINEKKYDSKWIYDLTKEIINSKSFLFTAGVWKVSEVCEGLVCEKEDEEIEELISDTKILAELFAEMINDPALYMEHHEKESIINDINEFLLNAGLAKISMSGVLRYINYRISASKLPDRVKHDYIYKINYYADEIIANRLSKGRER